MSVETNKAAIRRWFDTVNGTSDTATILAVMAETHAPDLVDHDGPNPEHGYAVVKATVEKGLPMLKKALPDLHIYLEQLIGEGDLLAVRMRGEATHTGDVPGISATGKRITWTENEIWRFRDGKIVESWGEGGPGEALAGIGLGTAHSAT